MIRTVVAAHLLLISLALQAAEPSFKLPVPEVRAAVIDALKTDIERVDGDGLTARGSRPQNWEKTIARLRDEALRAQTPEQFGRVLLRFDATIPNHHMKGYVHEALEPFTIPPFPFAAGPEFIDGESQAKHWRVMSVSTLVWNGADAPAPGDVLLAINDSPMSMWSDENFTFCKSPLRSQCERELFRNLGKQVLAWQQPEPLRLRLSRAQRTWEVVVPLKKPDAPPPSLENHSRQPLCGVEPGRYPGFESAYIGINACVFKSRAHPGIYVLRIPSFSYKHDSEEDIDSIRKETRHLYDGFWKSQSGGIRTLIVDVIDNHGGNEPIEWYRLLFNAPFQEQYMQYRKLIELEGDGEDALGLWASTMWGEKGKETWFAGLKKDGRWAKTPTGGFLPPLPQFCADEEDCEHKLFTPIPHEFKGRVLLLMNRWCVSACVGFVYNLVDVFKNRVRTFGEPDSGDSTYARLYLDVFLDARAPHGVRTKVRPFDSRHAQDLDGAIYRQIVSVTRTTDGRGRVISALPQKIDVPVPSRWDQSEDDWSASVFAKALSQAR